MVSEFSLFFATNAFLSEYRHAFEVCFVIEFNPDTHDFHVARSLSRRSVLSVLMTGAEQGLNERTMVQRKEQGQT